MASTAAASGSTTTNKWLIILMATHVGYDGISPDAHSTLVDCHFTVKWPKIILLPTAS